MGRESIVGLGLLSLVLLGYFTVVEGVSSVEKDLTLTFNQKLTLDKFRQRMVGRLPHDYMKQDIYLVKWLRAKNFNIDEADTLLMENIKWRKANKMDTILQEDWSEFHEKYPYYLDTVAKDGAPIITGNFGDWDIRSIALAGRLPHLIRYLNKGMEDAVVTIRKLQGEGKNVTQFDFLINMENYNLVQHGCLQCISFYLSLINNYEHYYPGFADRIVLFNTPPVFEVVLRIIRPLMSPITRQSTRVFGQDKAKWNEYLWGIADKNQLAPEYGGTYKRAE